MRRRREEGGGSFRRKEEDHGGEKILEGEVKCTVKSQEVWY